MVVPSIGEYLEKNAVIYAGFSRGPLIVNSVQKVREMFISDGHTVIELLEPDGESSPIAGFLKRNRAGGLVHLALDVDNLEATLREIENSGGKVVLEPTPDIAFQGRRIAFAVLNGQITEFIERRKWPVGGTTHD